MGARENIRLVRGRVRVELSNGIQEALNNLVEDRFGDVHDVLKFVMHERMNVARNAWPTKGSPRAPYATGRSARSFALQSTVRQNADGNTLLEVAIVNNATSKTGFPYAAAIRSATAGQTFGRKKSPWNEFIGKPLRRKARQVAADIAVMTRRAMEK